jgi:hypothetical protein
MTDDKRPGAVAGPSSVPVDTADDSAPARQGPGAAMLAQLRRREDAARRLPPLLSGRRDPLSARERADGWARP